jgi:hypothetical protein
LELRLSLREQLSSQDTKLSEIQLWSACGHSLEQNMALLVRSVTMVSRKLACIRQVSIRHLTSLIDPKSAERSRGTLRFQDTLPKMPVTPLEVLDFVLKKYFSL